MLLNVIKKLSLPGKYRRKLLVWIFTCLSITFCKFTSGTYRLMLNNGPNYLNNKNVYRRSRWEGERSKLKHALSACKCIPNAYHVHTNAIRRTLLKRALSALDCVQFKRTLITFKRLQTRIECIETLSNVRGVNVNTFKRAFSACKCVQGLVPLI